MKFLISIAGVIVLVLLIGWGLWALIRRRRSNPPDAIVPPGKVKRV